MLRDGKVIKDSLNENKTIGQGSIGRRCLPTEDY